MLEIVRNQEKKLDFHGPSFGLANTIQSVKTIKNVPTARSEVKVGKNIIYDAEEEEKVPHNPHKESPFFGAELVGDD